MELQIQISTPPGFATSKNKDYFEMRFIKKVMFAKAKIKEEWVNEDGSAMFWKVDVSPRNYLSVSRNVYMYDNIVSGVFNNKHAKKALKRLADSPEDYDKVTDMMKNGTKIEIIKQATAEEIFEAQKSRWTRAKEWIKRKFDKKEPEYYCFRWLFNEK